ncbi:hypothetical protein ACFRKD_31750 [Streptomyces niveus]|uniref:hypothetical protein n=1 Tax=Streptomyces niveus TaxID=193462 RepID=UPI0036B03DC0
MPGIGRALRAGASGFVGKDMALNDILAAIRVVAVGDALLVPGITRRLIADFAGRPPQRSPQPVAGISEQDRGQLVITAYETGLVTLPG